MPMKAYFKQLFEHAYWANMACVQTLKTQAEPPARSVRLLAHIVVAEDVWYTRLIGGSAVGTELWPEWTVEQCEELAEVNRGHYSRYLDSLTDQMLFERVAYRNSQGVAFETPVQEILTHVALHGSYHRGQIAANLRQEGFVPQSTDFIRYVRFEAERG
jgi:uncharacterized damage-inducible protein DinB